MTHSRKSKEERTASRRIPFELGRDENGPLIAYCPYHRHRQIIGNEILIKCMDKRCSYLEIFRRGGNIPKEGIMLQILIIPNKETCKTENQRKKIEERLYFSGETIKVVTGRYVQSLFNGRGCENQYNVSAEVFYPQNKRELESCPLYDYPKQKKEKEKRGGRKKSI